MADSELTMSLQNTADYWDDHPQPLGAGATDGQKAAYNQQMTAWKAKFGPAGPSDPLPPPPSDPGNGLPGAGTAAGVCAGLTLAVGQGDQKVWAWLRTGAIITGCIQNGHCGDYLEDPGHSENRVHLRDALSSRLRRDHDTK